MKTPHHLSKFLFGPVVSLALWAMTETAHAQSIPAPVGFIEGAGASPMLRRAGTVGLKPSEELLGFYLPANSLAAILNKGSAEPGPLCTAISTSYPSVAIAKQQMELLARGMRSDFSKRFNPDDPEIKKLIAHYEEIAKNVLNSGTTISLDGGTPLGITTDSASVLGCSMIGSFTMATGSSQMPLPFAMSAVFLRLGDKRVELRVAYPFQSSHDIDMANNKMAQWVSAIQAPMRQIVGKWRDQDGIITDFMDDGTLALTDTTGKSFGSAGARIAGDWTLSADGESHIVLISSGETVIKSAHFVIIDPNNITMKSNGATSIMKRITGK